MFIGLLSVFTEGIFDRSLASNSEGRIKCLSLINWPCQTRPRVLNINFNKTLFQPFIVSVNKCCGSCNIIDDTYTRVRVPNKVKNMNVKVFNLMSRLSGTWFLVQHESCEYKCGLNESV